MRTLSLLTIFLVFSITIVKSDLSINFSRNVTGSLSSSDWQFRSTNLESWNLEPLIGVGVYYSSLAVGAQNKSIDGDSLWGAASVVTGGFPLVWLAYWDAEVNFGGSTNFLDIDVTASAGFIAHSYVQLVEKDPQGNEVATGSLKQGILPGTLTYSLTNTGSSNGINWASFSGSSDFLKWSVTITFILSDVVGVIDYGGAFVGPKTLESVIQINNWPYANSANTLSLIMGVGTGAASVDGTTILSPGSNNKQVYFKTSPQATVDSTLTGVTVNYASTTDFDTYFNGDSNIQAQLSAATKGSFSLNVATVTFPANAQTIVYDPSVGSGQPVQDTPPSSASSIYSTTLVGVFAALCVIAVL